jgi:hypothetical protein
MATDDDRQAVETTEFQKKLDVMVATAVNAKKYDAACARVHAATTLLEEEKCVATILVEEARAAAAQIKPPSPTSPPAPSVALLRRTMTTRSSSSLTSTSRPPTCRTFVLSSQLRWTSPPRTTPDGATTS